MERGRGSRAGVGGMGGVLQSPPPYPMLQSRMNSRSGEVLLLAAAIRLSQDSPHFADQCGPKW